MRETASLRGALGAVPHAGDDWALDVSSGTRHRYEELDATAGLTAGLRDDWAAFTGRALDAATLAGLLTRHDDESALAAAEGTAGRYAAALTALDASDATVAQARAIRDRLARTTDVAVLSGWIDRNAAYDTALRRLYEALVAVQRPGHRAGARRLRRRARGPRRASQGHGGRSW